MNTACLLVCFCCGITLLSAAASAGVVEDAVLTAIETLHHSVLGDQYTDSTPFEFIKLGHQKGRFKNDIHLNFIGNSTEQLLRSLGISDNNMFVNQFVTEALIDTALLTPSHVPLNDSVIYSSLASSLRNRDKRFPSDVPIFGFWEQEWKACETAGGLYGWRQWPINMGPMTEDGETLTDVLKFIFDDVLHDKKDFLRFIEPLYWLSHTFSKAYNIPPDCDDTSTMIAFAHKLLDVQSALPNSAQLWLNQSFNLSTAFDEMVATAYCPGRANATDFSNTVDSRSYYWARGFIETIEHPDDCLVATWMESFAYMDAVYQGLFAGPINPLNANNVDASVNANALYGMSVALLRGASEWFQRPDGKGRRLYLTTARFVAWALRTQPKQKRPDLETLYYPAIINFPYFVARHLRMLESAERLPFPEMVEVRDMLRDASYSGGYEYIAEQASTSCGLSINATCWSGFLGQADTDDEGNPTPHYDDRFYTTAVAVNALMDFYTVVVGNGSSIAWKNTTQVPSSAIEMIRGGCAYLLATYNDPNISLQNTFFSGSVHSANGLEFWTPPTYVRDMATGTVYSCANITFQLMFDLATTPFWVVQGIIPPETYEQMLEAGCGQFFSWTHFEGYNTNLVVWPYWSAPVLSKAYAMLALSKARSLGVV